MSQGGRREKEEKHHRVPYHLHRRNFDHSDKLGFFDLEMNSDLGDPDPKNRAPLCFDFRDRDEIQSLKMMKVLSHKNVLHLRAIKNTEKKADDNLPVYVDEFTGVLYDLVGPMNNGFVYGNMEDVVPSPLLQELVSEIVDGLDYIKECGYYHGNLSLKTTLYHKHKHRYTIKLTNFQIKGFKNLPQCQREDWVSLGESLKVISDTARSFSGQFRVDIIDDLAAKLKSFSFQSLETVKAEVKDHPFFWNSTRRKDFFTTDVPRALKDSTFVTRIANIQIMLPWNIDDYDGYLTDMFNYRSKKKLTAYKVTEKIDHVKCISGMYTHEMEFKGNRDSVDHVVQVRNHRLCLDLKNAMS